MHRRRPAGRLPVGQIVACLLVVFAVGCGSDAPKSEPERRDSSAGTSRIGVPPGQRATIGLGSDGRVTMELVYAPPGEFEMGEDVPGTLDQRPHRVRITKGFFVGRHPVTVAQFRAFVNETGHRTTAENVGAAFTCTRGECRLVDGVSWRNPGFAQTDAHPVVAISWEDAGAFLDWARRTTGKPFRLPTEAEWEWVARGPEGLPFPWGRDPDAARVNHLDSAARDSGAFPAGLAFSGEADGYPFTAPAGALDNASWIGARDMLGNVWEWCSDWYEQRYYETSPSSDPAGPFRGLHHVLRGCSWMSPKAICRASTRSWFEPLLRATTRGFRVAVDGDAFAGTEAGG